MNRITGNINQVEVEGNLTIARVHCGEGVMLRSVMVDNPESAHYLVENQEVQLWFKETEVIIGRGDQLSISLQNRIPGKINTIKHNLLLSRLTMTSPVGDIVAIISREGFDHLNLAIGDKVWAMVKFNELMISAK